MNRILLFILTVASYSHVSAQNWGVEIFRYQLADQTSFVDVAIELNASEMTMEYGDSLWIASTEIIWPHCALARARQLLQKMSLIFFCLR